VALSGRGELLMKKPVNRTPTIVILPGAHGKTCSASDQQKIHKVVRDRLLSAGREDYRKVQVQVRYRRDGAPASLLVSMLRANTYTADVVEVHLDGDFQAVRRIKALSST
jgi:hypothetical protein